MLRGFVGMLHFGNPRVRKDTSVRWSRPRRRFLWDHAKGDAARHRNIRRNAKVSAGRTVRVDESTQKSGSFCSEQYCRRTGAVLAEGIPSLSEPRTGIIGRNRDTDNHRPEPRLHSRTIQPTNTRSSGRVGKNSERPNRFNKASSLSSQCAKQGSQFPTSVVAFSEN
jgi:hypothetical protein